MKNKIPKVSIVMPIYNAEKFLVETFESLRSQTLTDFEVICVNDGSIDKSEKIIKKYAKIDSRFKNFSQKNTGEAIARNNGLEHVKGETTIFLDADDLPDTNMLEIAYNTYKSHNLDIVIWQYRLLDNKTKQFKYGYPIKKFTKKFIYKIFSGKDVSSHLCEITGGFPWNKLFSTSFLKKSSLKFNDIKSFNDLVFSYTTIAVAKRIMIIDNFLFSYRINITTSVSAEACKHPFRPIKTFLTLRKNLKERGLLSFNFKKSLLSGCLNLTYGSFVIYILHKLNILDFVKRKMDKD